MLLLLSVCAQPLLVIPGNQTDGPLSTGRQHQAMKCKAKMHACCSECGNSSADGQTGELL